MVALLLADPSGSAGAIGGRSEERWCGLVIVPPTGRRPVGGALAPVAAVTSLHQGLPVGCLWFTHDLSTAAQKPSAWAWQGRKGDHVWEKRCSGLDLLGCDPGSGTTAQDLRTRETELAYRSLPLRDDARAASPSSLLCVASLAHLRCAHRLRCSLAGLWWRVRVGLAPGPPLNFKVRPFSAGGGPLECLFPYLEKPSQCNAPSRPPSPRGGCGTGGLMRWAHGFAECCIHAAT